MDDIVFLVKSYREDLRYYKKLVDSYTRFNADNIQMYVVVPKEDCKLFEVDDENVHVISEDILIERQTYQSKTSFSKGYIDQQVVKLSFWELGLCENYFCIDSDSYFIKFFHKKDFLVKGSTPYTIIYDDSELMEDKNYYNTFGKSRLRYNRIIKKSLEIQDEVFLFSCHGFAIISSKVMKSLKENFIEKNNLSYRSIIEKAPIEFTWYNYWLQKSRVIDIYPKTPIMKTFHTYEQLKNSVDSGLTKHDLLRNYFGIVINSNFEKRIPKEQRKRLRL